MTNLTFTFDNTGSRGKGGGVQSAASTPISIPRRADPQPDAEVLVGQRLEEDLAAIRKTADGWLRTVTTLLSLFSLSGLIFNKDQLAAAFDKGWSFWLPAGGAVVCGMAAIALGTFAAQGWPRGASRGNVLTVRSTGKAIRCAIRGLMLSLGFAAGCVALLVVAIVIMYD